VIVKQKIKKSSSIHYSDGSREIQRPRALCLYPVSRGVPHPSEFVTSVVAACEWRVTCLGSIGMRKTTDFVTSVDSCVFLIPILPRQVTQVASVR
jgi:hypothetical protein